MRATRGVSVLGLVWCLVGPGLLAQAAPPVPTGSRVRVWLEGPGVRRVTGTVVAVGSDSLSLARGQRDTIAVSLRSLTRLELSGGRRSVGSGALLGGAIGAGIAAAGALGWVATSCFKSSSSTGGSCPTGLAVASVVAGGGAVGAAIGAMMRPERWVPIGWRGMRASVGPGEAHLDIEF